MRDPARIPIVLNKLREIWERYPDMRFYQLIHVLAPDRHDEFATEDDVLLARIDKFLVLCGKTDELRRRNTLKGVCLDGSDQAQV